jgi:hypothetical protein
MKTNFKVLAAAVALMAVASCEELPGGGIGNGGENGGDNGAPIVNTLPFVAPEDRIVAKREGSRIEYFEYNQQGLLSKITNYRKTYNHEEGVMTTTTSFSYEGLLVKSNTTVFDVYKPYEGDQLYTSAGEGVYVKEENYYERRRTEGVLNAAGRLVGMTEYGCEYDSWEYTTKEYLRKATAYTYDDNGNLLGFVKRRYESTDGNNPSSDFSCMYTWENGNPKSMNYDGDGIYNFSFRDEEYVWPGMNLYWDLDATDVYGDVDITGLDGMKFANLLHRVSAVNPQTNEEVAMEMVYTFDTKGRVKTVNYKWFEEGEEWYDEDDAVEFYYGDETLPAAPVTVPVYLVKQVGIGANMSMPDSEIGTGSVADPNGFKITYHIKNVYSNASETYVTCARDGQLNFYADWLTANDITREQFNTLRSVTSPETYVEMSNHLFDDNWISEPVAKVISRYPVIGEVICDMQLNDGSSSNPFLISLYDEEQGNFDYAYTGFSEDFLRSRIKVSCQMKKTNDWDDYENWEFSHHIDVNLWPDSPAPAERFTWSMNIGVPKE